MVLIPEKTQSYKGEPCGMILAKMAVLNEELNPEK